MKKTTITMLCLAACLAAADTKITWLADVTADRAETVTGAQSNLIASAIQVESDPVAMAALTGYQSAAYWPPNATASSWFTFTTNSGAITITSYNIGGGVDVVIPDYINGLPVTEIEANAFIESGVTSISGAGNVVTVGALAFANCYSLTSVSLPQAQTVGALAFANGTSLTSVSLPQAQTVGNAAFSDCTSLTSVLLPQVQTVGDYAFGYCGLLTSVYFDNDAPTIGADIFAGLNPNQVTNYVTNPQATGWGATLAGMPVVRRPLYADAITLNGDTITEWPAGVGGETSIIAPLYDSGTNVTVTSTQSVYSVAVTGAGPVGIDWSGLSLDGTGRAEVTLRLNVTEWGGTNVTFSTALTFDQTPEILVTGVWEFAASTVDGATTRVRQTWPECCGWRDVGNLASGSYVQWAAATNASAELNLVPGFGGVIYKFRARRTTDVPVYASYFYDYFSAKALLRENVLLNNGGTWYLEFCPSPKATPGDSNYSSSRFYIDKYGEGQDATTIFTVFWRPANVNERAAYAAGWRP